jgi:hypothetical protein
VTLPRRRRHTAGRGPDPHHVDAHTHPEAVKVIDPTENVISLVQAAMRRQDDLRDLADAHATAMAQLRADYDEKLRLAETDRIDRIRAVDVAAVSRAADVAAAAAAALAAQVVTSAETLRAQVAATAAASRADLANSLEPLQKDIRDLRDSQSRGQGGKEQTADSRLNLGTIIGIAGVLLALVFGVIAIKH